MEFTYALRFRFDATNNEAEYEALIVGLRIAEQMGVKNLQANVDSRLVANQVNGTYVAKEADMVRYLEKVKALTGGFKAFTIKQIPISKNKKADALSKIASTSFAHLSKQVLVEELNEKSISEVEVLTVVEEEGDTWMTPIYKYLAEETLPADMKKARAIKCKSWWFTVINGILNKKSFLGPWLRCVGPLQANYVLREIHEGSCSMHAGTRSVVAKALRTGYYWPTMHRDARTLIRACQDCQVHKPIPRNPQQKLTPITSPWPFYKWGIDIAGPFPEGPGKVKFLIVAMDYFTKWIEAKPVATITGNQIKKFVWDNIVCRFGLPGEIISDNGKQFRDDPFKDWCEKLCINQHFASVKHPQTNGLVERANRSLGEGIKARLEARSKNWMEELPHVLWAHRTMIKSSNGDTPFSLTYGTEAVIPAEIGMPTIRTAEVDLVQNNEALEINLDLLEERREEAAIREAKSKAKMEKYYNAKVRNTSFKPGDLHLAEAEEAFKQMKQLIAELPMLTAPMEKEELIVYMAAAKETVSAVLMTKREAKQMPIYFVSKALRGLELNYTSMEKLVLALVHASKRLKRPRVSVKEQILADFIVERPEEDSPDTPMEEEEELPEPWILFTDGSSCTNGSGVGLILTNPEGMEFTYALRFRFDATNNEAEYEALIAGLRIAEQMGVKNLQANVDSRLVSNQVNGTYVAKEADMIRYLEKVRALTKNFKAFSIKQIPRSENKKADALSKIASTSFAHLSKQVLVEELKEKSISEVEILAVVEEEGGDTWMTPLFKYLTEGTLPADVKKARAIRRKSWRFANNIQNNEALEINLDLLEARREEAAIRDLVYRNNDASRAEDTGKLGPKWEGPYEVTEALGKGAYKLRDLDRKHLPSASSREVMFTQ
ncbi:reverse transcriptase domain-containing protein, partial [Tanacetum coccineum]